MNEEEAVWFRMVEFDDLWRETRTENVHLKIVVLPVLCIVAVGK